MSPVQHPVSGSELTFSLGDEMRTVREELGGGRERVGRTLVKEGGLRLTLVGLTPGGTIQPHKADGPISVQVLEGEIEFEAHGRWHTLGTDSLFVLDSQVPHSVRSPRGGMFLLTVVGSGAAHG